MILAGALTLFQAQLPWLPWLPWLPSSSPVPLVPSSFIRRRRGGLGGLLRRPPPHGAGAGEKVPRMGKKWWKMMENDQDIVTWGRNDGKIEENMMEHR